MAGFKSPINLTSLDCGRQPGENPLKHREDMQSCPPCVLPCCEAKVLSTITPCCPIPFHADNIDYFNTGEKADLHFSILHFQAQGSHSSPPE